MDNNIIVFPEIDKLKASIQKLKIEISMLILERDELLYDECKNIEMAYMLAFGALEYKVFEKECLYLRLKRKIQMIQSKINRQEQVNMSEIDQLLDIEFVTYQYQLDEKLNQLNAAIDRSNGEVLSEEDFVTLKKMYRTIVKALHPDLNTNATDEEVKLFHNAVQAYETGDLRTIELIYTLIADKDNSIEMDSKLIINEEERLIQKVQSLKVEIDEIKSKFPYTMKSIISDKVKIEDRKTSLQQTLVQFEEVISIYLRKIAEY
ncbi:hypothetical protein [Macrococcus capreoli]|uniref:hypothetical protein n=1 Tax=Macrococcus capreoli TaxID=2982690 RepID=UPI003F433332